MTIIPIPIKVEDPGNTWVLSDLHIDHTNILKYCPIGRDFFNIEEMNSAILDGLFSEFPDSPDTVILNLGDVFFGRYRHGDALKAAMQKMRGENGRQLQVIVGNHDSAHQLRTEAGFDAVYDGVLQIVGTNIFLSHSPVTADVLGDDGVNIHGHLHDKSISDIRSDTDLDFGRDDQYVNVSYDFDPSIRSFNLKDLYHWLEVR